jgi:hypothetical protein
MSLAACRERFPILAEATYLINHSLGAMPLRTRLAEYAHTWKTRGIVGALGRSSAPMYEGGAGPPRRCESRKNLANATFWAFEEMCRKRKRAD